jgi:choline-sulfatase
MRLMPGIRPHTAALAVLLALASCGADARRPDLLLVTIDTLRADALGRYGYERPTSPRLDAWAATAAQFDAAQATSSWTLPTLATLLTGHLPSTTHTQDFASSLPLGIETLAERLRVAGYETAAVASHTFLGIRHGLHQGFTHFDDDLVLFVADSHAAITSDDVTARAVSFIERADEARALNDDRPWFLWAHYFDPHDSYLAHAEFSDPFGTIDERDLYDGEIAFTDHHLGALLETLERRGLGDSTLVCVVSDHGEEWSDHGGTRHGHTLYQELVRVPLFLSGPGVTPGRYAEPVGTADLFPTLLGLLGLEAPAELPGLDLRPLFFGGALPAGRGLVSELDLGPGRDLDAIRSGDWKLIVDRESGRRSLFDLASDPGEARDLAAEHPERCEALLAELDRRLERARAAGAPFTPERPLTMSPAELQALERLGYGEGGSQQ